MKKLNIKNIAAFAKIFFVRYFIFINSIVIIVILLLGYKMFISPNILRLKAGKNIGLEERVKEEERLSSYMNELESMRRDYKNFTEEKLNELKMVLPKEEDFPGLFVQMQELALKNNFALNTLSIDHASSGSNGAPAENTNGEEQKPAENAPGASGISELSGGRIKELNVSYSITGGDYEDLKNFLRDIEKNIRIFDIYDINFGSVEKGSTFSINMRTYYLVF